ncbi:hypothetical protein L3X38_021905 [Prunus dulcis]|uniref:Uncharacterized protein n=1 Tax=Prunus dulcis TaxID=3755 RepID=A0AAD4Z427_PRUDU|nr:hypothetical protein L3X38_021905 [Prunus dulcis]
MEAGSRPGGGFLRSRLPGGARHLKMSRGRKSAEPQILAGLGDISQPSRNPGTHGPGVPKTREANVKYTDVTESTLDVCRHRLI